MVVFKTGTFQKELGERSILTLVKILGTYRMNGSDLLKDNGVIDLKLNNSFHLRSFFRSLREYYPEMKIVY